MTTTRGRSAVLVPAAAALGLAAAAVLAVGPPSFAATAAASRPASGTSVAAVARAAAAPSTSRTGVRIELLGPAAAPGPRLLAPLPGAPTGASTQKRTTR
ncbi:hypothetical protein AB0K43_26645 [Kitasatospora sp. NPDC049258]|uniref:hypothetical protein n=1 Tax=Kitasatospora sp. NPDC049258 TaxID=3155394 RepID=UPI0034299898